METTVEKKDLRDVIMDHLKSMERNLAWLSRKIGTVEGMGYNNLYGCLVEKRVALTQDKLDVINLAIDTAFTLENV
jgi:hypothetical protein